MRLYFSLLKALLFNLRVASSTVFKVTSAFPSLKFLFLNKVSYNLYSLPNSVLANDFFNILREGEEPPLRVSAVICLTKSSNKRPVFLYLECLIFIDRLFYKYIKIFTLSIVFRQVVIHLVRIPI